MPFTPFKKKTDKGKEVKAKGLKPWDKKKAAVASQAQINVFVKAAMDRYAELGVPRDIAEELLARKMTKIAEQLGMALPEDPSKRIVKLATARLTAKGIPEEQAKVMLTHEFSKKAFIEKVARVKNAFLANLKKNAQYVGYKPTAKNDAAQAAADKQQAADFNKANEAAQAAVQPSAVKPKRVDKNALPKTGAGKGLAPVTVKPIPKADPAFQVDSTPVESAE